MHCRRNLFLLFISANVFTFVVSTEYEDFRLEMINIVFRHGSRTPDLRETYPDDPISPKLFEPYGYGRLTKKGKREVYQLGKLVHELYKEFLDINRTADMISAISTDYDRTKMSTLLVLAGMLPPTEEDKWTNDLDWLPVTYNYNRFENDFILSKPTHTCPVFKKELRRVYEDTDYLNFVKENEELFKYVSLHTGTQIRSLHDILMIHQILDSEMNMNLTLPEWTWSVFPQPMRYVAVQKFAYDNYNPLLKRLYNGRILNVMTRNMMDKYHNRLTPSDRKIYLYGGHDSNIAGILLALGVFDYEFPGYASAVMVNLYSNKNATGDYRVKVSYVKNPYAQPEDKQIPGCEMLCPLEMFESILEPLFTKNYTVECESTRSLEF